MTILAHWPNSIAKQSFDEMGKNAKLSERLKVFMDGYAEAWKISEQDPVWRRNNALDLLDKMEAALIEQQYDDPSLALWKEMRSLSIDYLNEFYGRLGINFDVWDAESNYVSEARRISNYFVEKGHTTVSTDGLQIIKDTQNGGYSVVSKSNNYSTLYLTR